MSNLLDNCSQLPVRAYAKGDVILKEGHQEGEILVLKSGMVEIQVGDSTITTISTPGALFGEIALLLERGHSATAIALKPCEFHVLANAAKALANHPEINQEISRSLARRLIRASESIADLTKQVEFDNDFQDFEMMMLWDEENESY
jgi:CRP/FNR family transcriptional regulator, cyclic AMP receptor protein